MKKIIAVFLFGCTLLWSCAKEEESTSQADLKLAVSRLSAVKEWNLDEMYVNNSIVFSKGKPVGTAKEIKLGPNSSIEFDSLLEKAIFDANGKGKVKYFDSPNFEDFEYEINEVKNQLIIKDPSSSDEIFHIKSGSVSATSFEFESDVEGFIIRLKLKAN